MGLIKIEDKELTIKEWNGQRVVTAWDIAELHERDVKVVNQQFKRNKERLILGEDYFILKRDEILKSQIVTLEKLAPNLSELILFTESGYLMLVKTFTDEISWKIQRMLVKSYFKLKEFVNKKDTYLLNILKANSELERVTAINVYEVEYVKPLEIQVEEQSKELIYKQNIIDGFVEDIDVHTKKDIILRVIRKKGSDFGLRWHELYKVYREVTGINLKARCEGYNLKRRNSEKLNIFQYAVNFNHIDGLYDVCVKIFETDTIKILKGLGKVYD